MRVDARVGPATSIFLPVCAFSFATSSATLSLTSRLFQSTFSRVVEKTIFGLSCQIRAILDGTYRGRRGNQRSGEGTSVWLVLTRLSISARARRSKAEQ